MRKIFLSVTLTVLLVNARAQGHKVTLETPNFKSGLAYLTYYYGKSINVEDSAVINNKGIAVFKGPKKLEPGIYAIVFPGKSKLTDFLVGTEQIINIKADTVNLIRKTVVTGSKENILFKNYQIYVDTIGKILERERKLYDMAKNHADSVLHKNAYIAVNEKLNIYREDIIKKFPTSMLAALFNAMKEPKTLNKIPVTKADTLANYNYYKEHYWDGVTFMDDRIIRTPFFLPKLENYFRTVLIQSSDTIIKAADYMLLYARSNTEMYKFLLNWLTDEYINPKYMGQDAVFVHLFEKYHSKGISSWLNQKQLTAISNRAYMLMSNLIGNKAADLNMLNTADAPSSLYNLNSKYTVVIFWDPTCSHCKETIPKVDSIYRAKWQSMGVKIYAVLAENEHEKWLQYITEHNIGDWTHVYQTEEAKKEEIKAQRPSFKQLYDVTQTPTIYLLDKEKRIIAKKLTWEQTDEVLTVKASSNQQ